MNNTFDAIVVGGGHNTLSAAGYLAKAGYSTPVLEKNDEVGGGVVSQQVTAPGFIHDLHATAIFLIRANPLCSNDELELHKRHGLKINDVTGPYITSVFDDGQHLSFYPDVERTCEDIARFSQKDAETYRAMCKKNSKLLNLLVRGMFSPPLSMGSMLKLLEGNPDGRYMSRLMFSSAYDEIEQHFENSHVKCHLYKWISENAVSPEEVGTGLILLLLIGMGHAVTPGVAVGGSQSISNALRSAIEYYGGEIRTGSRVVKYNLSQGRITSVELESGEVIHAKKCVVSATPPWDLHQFIDGLDENRLGDINGLKPSSFGLCITHYALKEKPVYKNAPDYVNSSFGVECVVNDVDTFRRFDDALKYRELPTFFNAGAFCATNYDSTRAPLGQHTLYLSHFVPNVPAGRTLEDWDTLKHEFSDWMLEEFRQYTTNMDDDNILATSIESPMDMQRHSPSFRRGDCFGLAMIPRQFLGERPTPELAQYRVPDVEGLYLCGPAQHPGGGCIGGGRPVAMRILMDHNVDLKLAFNSL